VARAESDEGRLDEDVKALKEAIAEMEAGDSGQPFDDFCLPVRKSNHLQL
jgi:hypothetical protein